MASQAILASFVTIAILLAGCTLPQEAQEPGATERVGTGEYVYIDGRPYECHDTVDLDGVCDDYELDEGYTAAGIEPQFTSSAGTVEIAGNTYACADVMGTDIDVTDETSDFGRCETYLLT